MDTTTDFIGFQSNGSISYKANLVMEPLALSAFTSIAFHPFHIFCYINTATQLEPLTEAMRQVSVTIKVSLWFPAPNIWYTQSSQLADRLKKNFV